MSPEEVVIARAAEQLDKIKPTWFEVINPDMLFTKMSEETKINCYDNCVLDQAFAEEGADNDPRYDNGFGYANNILMDQYPDFHVGANDYGRAFWPDGLFRNLPGTECFVAAREAWRAEIDKRKAAA